MTEEQSGLPLSVDPEFLFAGRIPRIGIAQTWTL